MTATAILLASTVVYRERFADTPYTEHPFPSDVETVMCADELAEFAGRSGNQSWDRPNPATATNHDYLRAIIVQEHYSALEHASATFWITGISTASAHDLTSHRGLTYSQLSQRHMDVAEADYALPPAYRLASEPTDIVDEIFDDAVDAYAYLVTRGLANGLSLKEARDAARSVLPNCTETTLLVTGNMKTWREVIDKNGRPGADAVLRLLSQDLRRQLEDVAPNTFQDMPLTGVLVSSLTTGGSSLSLQSPVAVRAA